MTHHIFKIIELVISLYKTVDIGGMVIVIVIVTEAVKEKRVVVVVEVEVMIEIVVANLKRLILNRKKNVAMIVTMIVNMILEHQPQVYFP